MVYNLFPHYFGYFFRVLSCYLTTNYLIKRPYAVHLFDLGHSFLHIDFEIFL